MIQYYFSLTFSDYPPTELLGSNVYEKLGTLLDEAEFYIKDWVNSQNGQLVYS